MIIERQIKPQPKHFVGQTQPNRQKRAVRFSFFVCFLQSNQQNVYSVCTQCVHRWYIHITVSVQQPVRKDRRTTETRQEHKPRHLTERRIYIIPSSIYQLSATADGRVADSYRGLPSVTTGHRLGYRRSLSVYRIYQVYQIRTFRFTRFIGTV